MVLLIACVNVANMLLAPARLAGPGRWPIRTAARRDAPRALFRQLLAESLMLAAAADLWRAPRRVGLRYCQPPGAVGNARR